MDIAKINEIEKHFSNPVATLKKKESEYTIRAKELVSLYFHELRQLESKLRLNQNFTESERKAALDHISKFFNGECKL